MSLLFEPYRLRGITIPNRIWMSPMCQYSAAPNGPLTGTPNDWHRTHLISRAIGGSGLVFTEATAVNAEGRLSPYDTGLWNDTQEHAWTRVVESIRSLGAVPAVQLGHAGRKASTVAPWDGHRSLDPSDPLSWQTIGPTDQPYGEFVPPAAASTEDLTKIIDDYVRAAQRALRAGFQVLEIHAAHGYIQHQFLSPASNTRTDEYGGSFLGRAKLTLDTVSAVRTVWPEHLPLFVRVSATDWVTEEPGLEVNSWTPDQTVELAKLLGHQGVDLIDVSTGGNVPHVRIPTGPGYQVRFARRIQSETSLPAAAVGMITESHQAESILAAGDASAVLLARELLRDPYWPRRAARELGVELSPAVPRQYARAF
ncbi:NADH:flavin oxidoreductase/NADH oxidase [Mycobacterium sp. CBMA271]|uniref:NADH:flavin oxidoreductase/NADH oxidase n=1 Tax=unclassified Mycobacteroides TaxID=2618759 RepID=UPI0012DF2CFB|nr:MULTISPECIES: NADH:flavin oxidoreductase/NADH oxidase [unclassified Mycobacteroides]MUM19592.1 oxidoreductase [Mycobacteroides sp. CBMA 326]MUM24194.1 NADH:flavin oxidoreductase/NADH oxidase [Mycobacteroides sp. CBMA 271]